ncbi:hypothetical protein BV20DRAFT_676418 [Pilatotrama ljubarskyi]|nr:hypothetical protein BV20DRAFT_676418 [Pilatotrama ljubarskyi]
MDCRSFERRVVGRRESSLATAVIASRCQRGAAIMVTRLNRVSGVPCAALRARSLGADMIIQLLPSCRPVSSVKNPSAPSWEYLEKSGSADGCRQMQKNCTGADVRPQPSVAICTCM